MTPPYYQDQTVTLHHGRNLDVLRSLADRAVDCCVTSPPYFGLRDYGMDGQYGAEGTPAEFVANLVATFREVRRVLADDGTMWLNLGDSYSQSSHMSVGTETSGLQGRKQHVITPRVSGRRDKANVAIRAKSDYGLPVKNLLGIPWRVAFALQDDGWILRRDIIWAKRNVMPEAVTDRPTTAHEYIFMFTKKPRYWYDADAIREESDPTQEAHNQRYAKEYAAHTDRAAATGQPGNVNNVGIHSRPGRPGRNSRSVWTMSSEPFPGSHFAVFPPELPRRCIVAGCKPGGTVLDPFHGSGTTGKVAVENGRKYIGIELNAEYLDLSLRTRLTNGVLDFGGEAS